MLELTTTFRGITTSTAVAHSGLSPHDASRKAASCLAYICRPTVVGEAAWSGAIDAKTGIVASRLDEARTALRLRARDRAEKGGAKKGARVLESGIVSLPNDWPAEARQAACERIAAHLAPKGSEAAALVVSHRDRAGVNEHLHYAAVDGHESIEAARARRPNAKRIRRAQVLRMAEGGRPKKLRAELAGIINEIAEESDLARVEWRSFAARGIVRAPGTHDGPTRRAQRDRVELAELNAWLDAGSDLGANDALADLGSESMISRETSRPDQASVSQLSARPGAQPDCSAERPPQEASPAIWEPPMPPAAPSPALPPKEAVWEPQRSVAEVVAETVRKTRTRVRSALNRGRGDPER